jgi:uncharacterized protein (DUF58 family)
VVAARLESLLSGDLTGLLPGLGSEAGDAREYQPGDDVRRMDWSVTARTGRAHVRDTVADRALQTAILVDRTPSMSFGSALLAKDELALIAAAAFGFLTVRRGGAVTAITTGSGAGTLAPARGRAHVAARLALLSRQPSDRCTTDLAHAMGVLARRVRSRNLAVVVSDFLDNGPWPRALRALAARADAICVEIVDPRELTMPDIGVVTLLDTETGRTRQVETQSLLLRERFADAAREERAAIAAAIRSCGAAHLRLSTDRDWALEIARFVIARRRAGQGRR